MEFLNSLDFIAVGFIICIIWEAVYGIFNMRNFAKRQMAAMGGGLNYKKDEFKLYESINGGACIIGLFYIFFVIRLFWPVVVDGTEQRYWLIALLLIVLGMISGSVTNTIGKKWKDAIIQKRHEIGASAVFEGTTSMEIDQYERAVSLSWIVDKMLSIGLLCFGLYLHLGNLGIIG